MLLIGNGRLITRSDTNPYLENGAVVLDGQYGLDGLALSIPSLLGRQGLEEILEIPLSPEENRALRDSAEQMKQAIESLSCAPAL